jgi:hypothetical protein
MRLTSMPSALCSMARLMKSFSVPAVILGCNPSFGHVGIPALFAAGAGLDPTDVLWAATSFVFPVRTDKLLAELENRRAELEEKLEAIGRAKASIAARA